MCCGVIVSVSIVTHCVRNTVSVWCFFFFQAEDGIRDLVRSRGLGDVYKRQPRDRMVHDVARDVFDIREDPGDLVAVGRRRRCQRCLLFTSDAADERSSVDLGGRRIIKKKKRGDIQERVKQKKLIV